MRKFLIVKDVVKGKENENPATEAVPPTATSAYKAVVPPLAATVGISEAPVKKEIINTLAKEEFRRNHDLFKNGDAVPFHIKDFSPCAPGQPLPYSILVDTFEAVSNSSGRLEKENYFSRLFASIMIHCPQELESIVYLASSHVFPAYAGLELGVGDILLIKSIAGSTGRRLEDINNDYDREGDLGIAAVQSRAKQKILTGFGKELKPLTASEVLETFRLIATIKGKESQSRKIEKIRSLLTRCNPTGQEAKYIVRALQGKLRIGTAEPTVLISLAHAIMEVQKLELSQFDVYPQEEIERMAHKE